MMWLKFLLSLVILANLAQADTLKIGISADYPPFDMMVDGKVSGFDADVATRIAQELNLEPEIKEIDFAGLIPALNSNIIDIAISNITDTPDRKKAADFTLPYYFNKVSILYKKKNQFISLKDINQAHIVGVQLGTNFHDYLKLTYPDIRLLSLSKYPMLFEELRQDKISYLIIDKIQAEFFVNHNNDFTFTDLPEFTGKIAIALKHGATLTHQINQIIKKLTEEGFFKSLEQKWLVDSSLKQPTHKVESQLTKHIKFIAEGMFVTLEYAYLATFFGLVISLGLTFLSQINSITRLLVTVYISVIRGTPVILQLSLIYFALPNIFNIKIPIMTAGLIGFSINSAAYVFEHIKAGIRSIDVGQIEAAKSMGFSNLTINRVIVLPQVIKNITPSIINEIINLIKETAIISVFGVSDIMRKANIVAADTYDFLTPLIIAGICYYTLITTLTLLLHFIEKRFYHAKA
ncbi:ABC transporter substrate-binding protein/permease [Rickettsiales endosymbiont of Stachyamoeba lipophora]|uniref:ABC transporter substrate-binding protein/permease n=1 Tax=Rickettsiales endosymbiont of Stachyamoeba lipophora TaxID=2486578 RepID=UPI000F647D69|nr:ABC transporter substrate-binding protein/permease [Rickettsiales endosymbiont of Stachyamoeba lipophora]AZL15175.1 ABC transporter permease subunit [Rickettsiales endosymbiont of Stachyamoeba lipophora]